MYPAVTMTMGSIPAEIMEDTPARSMGNTAVGKTDMAVREDSVRIGHMRAYHLIEPIYDERSKILILGSFPSVKSREAMFFYHHPQNRFWKILGAVYGEETPQSIPQKKKFLLRHGIALWDVIASCEVTGSSDSSIRNVKVNDLERITKTGRIAHVYTNGNLADQLYHKYFDGKSDIPVTKLPSSSPANAAYSLERLVECWKVIYF